MKILLTQTLLTHEQAYKQKLFSAYDWHQFAWKTFPNLSQDSRHFLTRLYENQEGFRLLIQSEIPPACPEISLLSWESKEIPSSFWQRDSFRFSLLANPSKKVRSNSQGKTLKNSRRVALHKREDLLEWMNRKSTLHGFTLLQPESLSIIPQPNQVFRKKSTKDSKPHCGKHTASEFIGNLKVNDTEKFLKTIRLGIGSAKAFGFGMLCLSPL